jgi:hypothetical protein
MLERSRNRMPCFEPTSVDVFSTGGTQPTVGTCRIGWGDGEPQLMINLMLKFVII